MGVTRRAIGISALAQALTFVLSFLNVIAVARLLTPAEIGVFSVAMSFQAIAHVFREFGVNQYLVQAREVTRDRFRAAFTLTLISSWSIAAGLVLASGPLSGFYRHEGVAAVMRLMAVTFLLLPLGTPSMGMMRRELRFGQLAGIRVVSAVVTSVVTIGAAWQGQSYLSMAWGAIAGQLSNLAILTVLRRHEVLMLPGWRGIGDVAKFGSGTSAVSLISELTLSAPDMVLGRTMGFSAVALHSRAAGLRDMFLSQVHGVVLGVHLPTFAQALRDGGDPKAIYSRVVTHLVAVTMPAMLLMAVMAEPLIRLLFGAQWVPSAHLASLMCVGSLTWLPYAVASPSLIAGGWLRAALIVIVVALVGRLLALSTSVWNPLEVVVIAVNVATLVEAAAYQHQLKRCFGIGLRTLWPGIWQALRLAPLTLAVPTLLWLTPLARAEAGAGLLAFVALGLGGGAAGWLAALAWQRHPLWAEVRIVLEGLGQRVRALVSSP